MRLFFLNFFVFVFCFSSFAVTYNGIDYPDSCTLCGETSCRSTASDGYSYWQCVYESSHTTRLRHLNCSHCGKGLGNKIVTPSGSVEDFNPGIHVKNGKCNICGYEGWGCDTTKHYSLDRVVNS